MGSGALYRQEQKGDLETTENSYRAIASLMSTSGRLLQIIMSRAKRDLSSFSSTTSFHLDNLTTAFPSLELPFLHSRPQVNLSCFQPFINKSVEKVYTHKHNCNVTALKSAISFLEREIHNLVYSKVILI